MPDAVHRTLIEYGDHKAIHTPDGLVIITCLEGVGTQVMVYDDPEQNPIAMIELRPRPAVNDGPVAPE